MSSSINTDQLKDYTSKTWNESVFKSLSEYISIPAQSPLFDADWAKNGHIHHAVTLLVDWVNQQQVEGLKLEVLESKDQGRTPLIYMELPGHADTSETVLLYAHLDKQPPMTADWSEGLGPWTPVLKDGKLYGRGSADDGYGCYSAITAIKALQLQQVPIARCVILIEASEESGSVDLPHYVELLKPRIGTPSLVVCLDSGCANYDQLWLTSSLRGMMAGTLTVKILNEGVHSGMASGIVPSSFRIMRQLLDRIDDAKTGKMPDFFYVDIPAEHEEYAAKVAETVGTGYASKFPFVKGSKPVTDNVKEQILNGCWRPTVSYTGADGFPPTAIAGNVLRPSTTLTLAFRLPPSAKGDDIAPKIKELLERDPPYNAQVEFKLLKSANGWVAPQLQPWLSQSLEKSSQTYWNKSFRVQGEGGSIPFMGMLGERFPQSQFVVTGLLGPSSNAHGPNESLDVEFYHRLTPSVALLLADHYTATVANKGK